MVKIIAILIFILIYVLIVSEKVHRTILALWGAILFTAIPVLTPEGIQFGLLTQTDLLKYENWEALGLIFGTFALVAALRESGFFRWLGLTVLKFTNYDPVYVFFLFGATSAVLAAFMNSITVLMFMAALTIEVCGLLKITPFPYLLMSICSANIGGSATMVGDPPNIIIGTSCHFAFIDFVINTGPIAIAVFLVNSAFFYLFYRKIFGERKEIAARALVEAGKIDPRSAIIDVRLMRISVAVFGLVVLLLTLHHVFNLSVAFIGILGASLILLLGGEKMPEIIERIDWHTLLFFACLFIMVGGLEKTGVLTDIAQGIKWISGENPFIMVMLVLWTGAVFSAFVDNVPFAAAMVPIVKSLSAISQVPLATMAWALALGTDIGGNATPIGASANIVGMSVYEKRTGAKARWREYCRVAVPATIISILVSSLLIYLRYLL